MYRGRTGRRLLAATRRWCPRRSPAFSCLRRRARQSERSTDRTSGSGAMPQFEQVPCRVGTGQLRFLRSLPLQVRSWTAAPSRFRGRCRRFQAGRRGIEGFGCPQQNQARWSVARRIRPCVASPASRGHSARTEERHRPASRHRMKARPESPARDSAKRPHLPGRVAALVGSGVSGSASASVRDKAPSAPVMTVRHGPVARRRPAARALLPPRSTRARGSRVPALMSSPARGTRRHRLRRQLTDEARHRSGLASSRSWRQANRPFREPVRNWVLSRFGPRRSAHRLRSRAWRSWRRATQ